MRRAYVRRDRWRTLIVPAGCHSVGPMRSQPSNATLILDEMIALAKAACDRYRQRAEIRHKGDRGWPQRRAQLASSEATLERLKAQRAREPS